MGLLLLTINYVKCFKCLFILLCLPRETLLKCFLYKRRGRNEDALLEIMAMNVFWLSSRTVVSCTAVSEIHFASG